VGAVTGAPAQPTTLTVPVTGADGFSREALPVGTYTLTVSQVGSATVLTTLKVQVTLVSVTATSAQSPATAVAVTA
jgi:predicted phage tail protein